MKFNMNNYATVILTEVGAKAYNARWDGLRIPVKYTPPKVETGHVLRAQLWTLFQDFGQSFMLGSHAPFESCIIEFDEKDFEK